MRSDMFRHSSYEHQYMNALRTCFNEGYKEVNKRTGHFTKRIEHILFTLDLAKMFPVPRAKKVYVKSAIDEIMWIMQRQSNKREDINSDIWNEWVGEDGTIGKAYGYQIAPNVRTLKECLIEPRLIDVPESDILPVRLWDEVQISDESMKADSKVAKLYLADTVDEFIVIKYVGEDSDEKFYDIQYTNTGYVLTKVSINSVLTAHNERQESWNYGLRTVNNVGYAGDDSAYEGITMLSSNTKLRHDLKDRLRTIWEEMIKEVYNEDGTRRDENIFVDERWHSWINFLRDARYLPNWRVAKDHISAYSVSKDYFISNCYSKDTCAWIPDSEVDLYDYSAVYNTPDENGKYARIKQNVNQINSVIKQIKEDPSSRRMVLTLWNPHELDEGNLEPCVYTSTFTVVDGALNCAIFQRSGDSMLGVPFNTVQYATLTHMLASACGLKVGKLSHFIVDFHIYDNALEGAEMLIKRYDALELIHNALVRGNGDAEELLSMFKDEGVFNSDTTLADIEGVLYCNPTMNLPAKDFYDYILEDVKLNDYKSLSPIKIKVVS